MAGNIIQSDNILLVPYLRGHSPRAILGSLWSHIEEAGDWEKLLWEEQPGENGPVLTKGDLVDWVTMIENPYDPAKLAMGIEKATNNLAGVSFFKQFKGTSAHGSFWMKPIYRGVHSRDFLNLTMRYAYEVLQLDLVYACTPHTIARNLIKKVGFKDKAKIKGTYLLTNEKEDFYV